MNDYNDHAVDIFQMEELIRENEELKAQLAEKKGKKQRTAAQVVAAVVIFFQEDNVRPLSAIYPEVLPEDLAWIHQQMTAAIAEEAGWEAAIKAVKVAYLKSVEIVPD